MADMIRQRRTGWMARLVLLVGGAMLFVTGAAHALEEKKDEKEKLKVCERRMCDLIVKKAPATGDIFDGAAS